MSSNYFFKLFCIILQPYWNYRDQPSYLTDERHGARQSVEGGSQSSYETGYTAGGLRSYAAEAYSAGKFIRFDNYFFLQNNKTHYVYNHHQIIFINRTSIATRTLSANLN